MDPTPDGQSRDGSFAAGAEWVVEEADLHAAAKATPGSTLALVRWPLAFFIAYVGVGLANPDTGPAFAFGSGVVITLFWIVLALGARGSRLRRVARLPQEQRSSRIAIDANRVRLEMASGHVNEFPLRELTRARLSDTGLLLEVARVVLFVPRRAMRECEDAWKTVVANAPVRTWPTGIGVTLGIWAFAVFVAVYAHFK